jgi:outer membrane murein-binding lipoprotein Lpp
MVRHGVGVVVAVVALAGCGSSEEDKVASLAKQLASATKQHDGAKMCHELLHPNTVHAVERLARADAVPGGPRPTCEQKYRTSRASSETIEDRIRRPTT